MIIRQLISKELVATGPQSSLREVAKLMRDKDVSSVVITGEKGEPLGIITERDVTRAVAEGLDYNVPASKLVKGKLITIEAEKSLYDALELMAEKRIRHLLVTDGGKVVGVISLREVANTLNLMMARESTY